MTDYDIRSPDEVKGSTMSDETEIKPTTITLGEQIDRVRAKLKTYQTQHFGKQVWVLCGTNNPLYAAGIRNLDGAIFHADDSLTLTDWKDFSKNLTLQGALLYFTLSDPDAEMSDEIEDDWDD